MTNFPPLCGQVVENDNKDNQNLENLSFKSDDATQETAELNSIWY